MLIAGLHELFDNDYRLLKRSAPKNNEKINAHTVALIQRLQQSIKKNYVFLISQRLWHRSVLNSKERH